MRTKLLRVLPIVLCLLGARVAPGQPAPPDMKDLKVKAPEGWDGDYNKNLSSWTYEKYIEVGEDRKPNRVYINKFSDDFPTKAKEFAAKLKEKDFLDGSYVWTEVSEPTEIAGGWLIQGTVKDYNDKDAKPGPCFAGMREIGGLKIIVKGVTLVNEDMRKEGIEILKSAAF
jgi:hypothetical protein